LIIIVLIGKIEATLKVYITYCYNLYIKGWIKMKEKRISKRRLRYILDKMDDYWFDRLHPNEVLEISVLLRDFHTGEVVGPEHVIISRFGAPYVREGDKDAKN